MSRKQSIFKIKILILNQMIIHGLKSKYLYKYSFWFWLAGLLYIMYKTGRCVNVSLTSPPDRQ